MIGRESFATQTQGPMSQAQATTEVRMGGASANASLQQMREVPDISPILSDFNKEMESINSMFGAVGEALGNWEQEKEQQQFMKGYLEAAQGQSEADLEKSGGSFLGNLFFNNAEHAGARAYKVVADVNNEVIDVAQNIDQYREMDPAEFRNMMYQRIQSRYPEGGDLIAQNAFQRSMLENAPSIMMFQTAARKQWVDAETLRQNRAVVSTTFQKFDSVVNAYNSGQANDEVLQNATAEFSSVLATLPQSVTIEQIKDNPPQTVQGQLIAASFLNGQAAQGGDPATIGAARTAIRTNLTRAVKDLESSNPDYKAALAITQATIQQNGANSEEAARAEASLVQLASNLLGADVQTINTLFPGVVTAGLTTEQISGGFTRDFTIAEENQRNAYRQSLAQVEVNFAAQVEAAKTLMMTDPVAGQLKLRQLAQQASEITAEGHGNRVTAEVANTAHKAMNDMVINAMKASGASESQIRDQIEKQQEQARLSGKLQQIVSDEAGNPGRLPTIVGEPEMKNLKGFENFMLAETLSGDLTLFDLASRTPTRALIPENTVAEVKSVVERSIRAGAQNLRAEDRNQLMTLGGALAELSPERRNAKFAGAAKIGLENEMRQAYEFYQGFTETGDERIAVSRAISATVTTSGTISYNEQQIKKETESWVSDGMDPVVAERLTSEAKRLSANTGRNPLVVARELKAQSDAGYAYRVAGEGTFFRIQGLPVEFLTTDETDETANINKIIQGDQRATPTSTQVEEAFIQVLDEELKAQGAEGGWFESASDLLLKQGNQGSFDGESFFLDGPNGQGVKVRVDKIRERIYRTNRPAVTGSTPGAGLLQFGTM